MKLRCFYPLSTDSLMYTRLFEACTGVYSDYNGVDAKSSSDNDAARAFTAQQRGTSDTYYSPLSRCMMKRRQSVMDVCWSSVKKRSVMMGHDHVSSLALPRPYLRLINISFILEIICPVHCKARCRVRWMVSDMVRFVFYCVKYNICRASSNFINSNKTLENIYALFSLKWSVCNAFFNGEKTTILTL